MPNIKLTLQYDGTRYLGWTRPAADGYAKTISYRISSVLQFKYNGYCINILDTPGHALFLPALKQRPESTHSVRQSTFTQSLLFPIHIFYQSLTNIFRKIFTS